MDTLDKNAADMQEQDAPEEQQCARCKEHEEDQAGYEFMIIALALIGPILGILIGMFAGKKLIGK